MAKRTAIPTEIKAQVQAIVDAYNAENKLQYVVEFKGAFCYFSRLSKRKFVPRLIGFLFGIRHESNIIESKLARLTWTGNIQKWDLAIFLYSRETYTTDYWGFPGINGFNGTVLSL